ncbi:MAG: hypothetical protein KAS23_07425 [Anaerohalosphaera sp.]|nr:hypothetical protein [Anaerohalosphaera sp.]
MSTKKILLVLLVIVLCYFSVKMGFDKLASTIEMNAMVKTFDGNSSELDSTIILPALDSPLVKGKNNIWCSTFQLAWNELRDNVIQAPIIIADSQEICDTLNNAMQSKKDISAESYFVAAGKVSDGIIPTIESGMAKQFPSVKLPELDAADEMIAYSYLETYIKFKKPFRENEDALMFTDSAGVITPVSSFGVWDGFQRKYKPICKQVEVLYCESNKNLDLTEFALDLCKFTKPYQIVIAVTEPKESLAETYKTLQKKIRDIKSDPKRQFSTKFSTVDVLEVPDMFWKIDHHFTELEGKALLNPGFNGLPVSQALQSINFRLDRTGVILESSALLAVQAIPRYFICDKPFLIYLKKRDAEEPFFMMWVDNAELLRQFD